MSAIKSRVSETLVEDREQAVLMVLNNLVWPLLLLTLGGFGLLLPDVFLTSQNLQFLMASSAALGSLALALGICLLSGNFDLSIGSIAGFSAMATALILANYPIPGVVGIIIVIGIGTMIGMLNGISVAYLGVNPFLQTLAFLIIFEGATVTLSTTSVSNLPESYLWVGGESIFGISAAIIIVGLIYFIAWYLLNHSTFGLSIYSVGGDRTASSKAGINDKLVILSVFMISGALSGFAGLLLTGFTGAATPVLGNDMLFPAFAAAVIGGISLFGGRGNVIGAAAGVLLLGAIQSGLNMMAVDPSIIDTINGVILLTAILIYTVANKYRKKVLSK